MKQNKKKTKTNKPKVWVLVDDRIGNSNQAIELAEAIGESFEVKPVEYNKFAKMPSTLISMFPIHVSKKTVNALAKEEVPELIISAGRRTAALALHLRKSSGKKTKIVQIMRPNLDPQEFEMIILPQHDNFSYTLPNIVRVIGALTNVREKFPKVQKDFVQQYPDLKNFIAVIVGGSTKNYHLSTSSAEKLASILKDISNNQSLPLFITFSRRTPEGAKKHFREQFSWPNIIYDPASNEPNPYPAILHNADYVVTTNDSITMCSEAASSGKPIYVFCPSNFKSKKHNFFIQQLVDLGVARRLETTTNFLEKYEYEPLSEIHRVAELIRERVL